MRTVDSAENPFKYANEKKLVVVVVRVVEHRRPGVAVLAVVLNAARHESPLVIVEYQCT